MQAMLLWSYTNTEGYGARFVKFKGDLNEKVFAIWSHLGIPQSLKTHLSGMSWGMEVVRHHGTSSALRVVTFTERSEDRGLMGVRFTDHYVPESLA